MNELRFHQQRQMFFYDGYDLIVAEKFDGRSHKTWMSELGYLAQFEKVLRGYVDPTGVYVYRGSDFAFGLVDETTAKIIAAELLGRGIAGPRLPMWGGIVQGDIGARWRGRRKLGTVGSLARGIYEQGRSS